MVVVTIMGVVTTVFCMVVVTGVVVLVLVEVVVVVVNVVDVVVVTGLKGSVCGNRPRSGGGNSNHRGPSRRFSSFRSVSKQSLL